MNVDTTSMERASLGAPVCIQCASDKIVCRKEFTWCQTTQAWQTSTCLNGFFCKVCQKELSNTAWRCLTSIEMTRLKNDWFRSFRYEDVPGSYFFSPSMWKLASGCSNEVKKILSLIARTTIFDGCETKINCLKSRGSFSYRGQRCVWEICEKVDNKLGIERNAVLRELWVFRESEIL